MAEQLTSIAVARELIAAAALPLPAVQVELDDALGRVLSEDVSSDRDLPPFDSSAMDGYAVRAGAEGQLTIAGESRAGSPGNATLAAGEAMPISTGAVIPAGTGAVVEIELAERSGNIVQIPAADRGRNIRRAGEDVRAGQLVLAAGTALGPAELAALAALGRARVRCGAQPRVAVIVTGDELVDPGAALGPGQIADSNQVALAAQASRAGARVVSRGRVGDSRASTVEALAAALEVADLVCVSGGVSVGEHDHVRPALDALGVEQRFWGVGLKPGKPTWFGERSGTLVFALPGNPVSAMVTFQLFVRPALRRLAGASFDAPRATAVLDRPLPRSRGRTQAVRCRLHAGPDGWHVDPTGPQGSHLISSMLGAGALAIVEPGTGSLAAGERVDMELLDRG